jgi:nucleoside-diphosphate-sugar epimerase
MKVFLTGVDGYIGCILAPILLREGFEVLALDTGYYRDGWLYSDKDKISGQPQVIIKDLRNISERDLEGCDAVVHLAELSNDPLGENNPTVTHEINHKGSVRLAELARAAGAKRFVYTSSCSVYGLGSGEFLDEGAARIDAAGQGDCHQH